jgi:hypothetical protein
VVVTLQLELPHPELDGVGAGWMLVVVVVEPLFTVVVKVLHPGTVEVDVTVSAMLTTLVNIRVVCCVVVTWSVMYAVCISVVCSVLVARCVSVSVVSFPHGSDEAQDAELVVELLHGSGPHGLELAVVCRFRASSPRAARALLRTPEPTTDTERSIRVDCSILVETA